VALASCSAISLLGLNGTVVTVETDISANLPGFVLVGLPDASLSEATSRVRAACANSGWNFPSRKVTVNLSPAAVPKSGSAFDLAIAVSVLLAMGVIDRCPNNAVFIGELGLNGQVRPVRGVLPAVLAARDAGLNFVFVPLENLGEAAVLGGVQVYGVGSLKQLVDHLNGSAVLPPSLAQPADSHGVSDTQDLDLCQVRGQALAVEALVVAAAGGHHLAMVGSPGSGKTMLAERLPGILPRLTSEQALEVAAVESLLGAGSRSAALNVAPRFETPHHTASVTAIVGGGSGMPRPGAVSKAHHGVLFLDEALEFQAPVLEALREPLESGRVMIHRSAGAALFPARFQLVLAANPCACGYSGSLTRACSCSFASRRRYLGKLSGPIFDRIDIRLRIQAVRVAEARGVGNELQTSAVAQVRVLAAREAAAARLAPYGVTLNAQLPAQHLRGRLHPGPQATRLLDRALSAGKTSMRGYDRCLRLAWSIADLAGASVPTAEHVAQAALLRGADSLIDEVLEA